MLDLILEQEILNGISECVNKVNYIFKETIEVRANSIEIEDLIKVIKDRGFTMSKKQFYKWMKKNKIFKDGKPREKYIDKGYFLVDINFANLFNDTSPYRIKVTSLGQIFILNKLSKNVDV